MEESSPFIEEAPEVEEGCKSGFLLSMTQSFSDSGRQTPWGRGVAWGGAGEGCALHLGLDRNAALSAPRHGQAGRENSSREGRRTALAAGPQPAREEL